LFIASILLSSQILLPVSSFADTIISNSNSTNQVSTSNIDSATIPTDSTENTGTWGTVPWSYDVESDTVTLESGEAGSPENAPWKNQASTNDTRATRIIFSGEIYLPSDCTRLFSGEYIQEIQGLQLLNVSKVTNMDRMFYLNQLKDLDIGNWDTSNVTNMEAMFSRTTGLTTLDLSNFNTSNVTNMYAMFSNSSNLINLNLSNFDTSKVTEGNLFSMFYSTKNLTELTLGGETKLDSSMYLSDNPDKFETTVWENKNSPYNQFNNSNEFMLNYDGSLPGTYTRELKANKQSITGNDYTMNLGDPEPTAENFQASAIDADGNPADVNVDFSKVDFNVAGIYDVTLSTSDGQSTIVKLTIVDKEATLVPIYRAYNPNDGDHLYTASQEEYDWITGLKWNAEGTAFQSVLSDYEGAIPVYRLYNPNSGEHFYTVSEAEYNNVSDAGWTKEQVGFYMVPKDEGDAVYRVFNPNATGPGSHLFTSSKEESTWLIDQGWTDEGIAFYSAK